MLAVVFTFLPIVSFLSGVRAREFENHRLAAFPTLHDGWDFFTALPGWAKDHLPLREQGVRANERIDENVFHDPPLTTGGAGSTYERVIFGSGGYWYLGEDVSLKCQPVLPQAQVLQRLDAIAKAVSESGRTFVLVVAPDKSSMVPEHLPSTFFGKQCMQQADAALWRTFDAQPWFIDIRSSLRAAAKKLPYPLYLQHDSHFDNYAGAVMVRDVVSRLDPQLGRRLAPVQLPTLKYNADLPPLIGRSEQIDFHPVTFRTPGVVNHFSDFRTIQEINRYRSSGPPGSLVPGPTFWFGDSFTGAAHMAVPSTFADITVAAYGLGDADPEQVIAGVVHSKNVVFEVGERVLSSGIAPAFSDGFATLMADELRAHPYGS